MTALKVGSESWWQSKHGPEWQRLNDEMFEVTFWWRDPQGSEEYSPIKRVWIYITGVTDHHQNSQPQSMQRIAGTDVWQWTTQLNANWRGSYCFIPTERDDIFSAPSPDRLELREGWRKLLPQAIADPLNPQSWKGGRGHAVSAREMPQAPLQPGWGILPASQTRDKDALTDEGVARVMDELSQEFDYIICDSPAGIERGAILAMYHADEAIIVTNPEISSVRDSDRIIGMLDSKTKKVENNEGRIRKHLCITRFNPERADKQEMLTIDDISKDILRVPTLGVIPECEVVLQASNEGKPVILFTDTEAGQAYDDLVARFLGEDRPYRHITVKPKGWLARLFGA